MKNQIPALDIPVDFVVSNDITGELLDTYGRFPCNIKACIFAICVRGGATAMINLTEQKVQAGDFATLLPNTFIQIKEVEPDTLFYIAGFSSDFYNRTIFLKLKLDIMKVVSERPVVSPPENIVGLYQEVLMLMTKIVETDGIVISLDHKVNIITFFFNIMNDIYGRKISSRKNKMTRDEEIGKEFVRLVLLYYTENRNVSFYAEKMGITLPHLCTTIKKTSGKTALEIITEAVIMDAKAQLKSTDKQIKEIAYSLGFDNVSFFNKYFKTNVDMTPKKYRELGI